MGYRSMRLADDPYRVLGLSPGATEREINRAYRQLAKLFHPDLNPGRPDMFFRFNEINRAHECLNDSAGRTDQGLSDDTFEDDAVVVMPI